MIRLITRWLSVGAMKRRARQLRDARKTALQAYDDAVRRNDDRDRGRALMILQQATHDELRGAR